MKKELFEISIKIFKNGEVEVGQVKQANAWDDVAPFPKLDETDLNRRGWEVVKKKRGRPRKLKRATDTVLKSKKRKYTKKSDYWTK